MIYLQVFRVPSRRDEEDFFNPKHPGFNTKNFRTCYTTKYPFGLFTQRQLPVFDFDEITIFCGNNGSGKSTLLNVIAEKLQLERTTPFNRSDFFGDYVRLCDYQLESSIPPESKIVTSDGVFEKVLDIRRLNEGIDDHREALIREYVASRDSRISGENRLNGLEDYERWARVAQTRKRKGSQSEFIRAHLMRNVQERSNGESALAHFVDAITDDALYLLDEPENSLSPSNQLQLKYFIEDCVSHHGCQFIISTHSPFLLSLSHALIYNIDEVPPKNQNWTELECVRAYKDFFDEHREEF